MEYEKSYWDNRYSFGGDSGYGSYGEQLKKKLDWICPLEFKTISELGCGDFNFGKSILERHPAEYIGYDISNVIVERNRRTYPNYGFLTYRGTIDPADLVMCVDVLFHIIEDSDVEKLLQSLEKAWTKYLVITAYERDESLDNHVRIRKFDPSRFGVPILREIVEEDGSLYFYIFKK